MRRKPDIEYWGELADMSTITYDRICCLLPTYGRSTTLLPEFLNSAIATASSPKSVCFSFCVNVNDKATKDFLKGFNWRGHEWEMFEEHLPSPNLAIYFNMLYNKTRTRGEPGTLVTMLGDDMAFKTPNWDAAILNQVNYYKGVGVFFCNDDYIARERCCVNLFVARDFVEATERPFMCEDFGAEMIDVVWTYIGRYTKTLHFYPDIIIKHNHNTKKQRAEWDETFKRLNVIQEKVHNEGGKAKAKKIAAEISETMKRKGLTGESVC